VRIPKDLDERLFRVLVETRRTKQDIIETFIREGLDRWESSRAGQGV
jgi:predicted DNA-binding protein